MIDAIQEIDALEPRLDPAPAKMSPPAVLTPAIVFAWAGMFAVVYIAASSMIALMHVRR